MLGFKNTCLHVNNRLVLIVHIYLDVVVLLLCYLVLFAYVNVYIYVQCIEQY